MDALLLSLLLCSLIEAGSGLPHLYGALKRRHHPRSVAVGMIAATGANAVLGAFAGGLVAEMLTPEARDLFSAVMFFAACAGLLLFRRPSGSFDKDKPGWLLAGAPALFLQGFGEGPQLVVAGIGAAYADPWMAGGGGWAGGVIACLLISVIGDSNPHKAFGLWLRFATVAILMMGGFFLAIHALRLA